MSASGPWLDRLRTNWLAAQQRADAGGPPRPAPRRWFDPRSWAGALVAMTLLTGVLWVVEAINSAEHYGLDRFGLRPRVLSGLWGILTMPFLHASWSHLESNTLPFLAVGWLVMIAGLRSWALASAIIVVLGGLLTWLMAPSGLILGASGLVFGWMGYLLSRAYFTRSFRAIALAVLVLVFFGTLLGGLLPSTDGRTSWQAHLFGFLAGIAAGAVLHPRRRAGAARRRFAGGAGRPPPAGG